MKQRLGYVDGLRALAALYVVVSHSAQTLWWERAASASLPIPLQWWLAFFGDGQAAVAVFIVLSGFSLTLPVARANWRISDGSLAFYRRRARRILPPYYAAMALSLALALTALAYPTGNVWDVSVPVSWRDAAQHVALIQDFTGRSTINYVFWSIAVECQIYLAFPALVWLWRRYDHRFCLALCLALALLLTMAARLTGWPALYTDSGSQFLFLYAGLFAVGMFAADAWSRQGHWAWDVTALGALALLCVGAHDWAFFEQDAVVGLLAVALLHARGLRLLLEWRPLIWVGGFSYSLYLIHAPLLQLVWQYELAPLRLGDAATYLLLLLVGGPLIALAAWGFYWVAERPFLNTRPVRKPSRQTVMHEATRSVSTCQASSPKTPPSSVATRSP